MTIARVILMALRIVTAACLLFVFVLPQVQYPGVETPEFAYQEPWLWFWFVWPVPFLGLEIFSHREWQAAVVSVIALVACYASYSVISFQGFMDAMDLVGKHSAIGCFLVLGVLYVARLSLSLLHALLPSPDSKHAR